MKKFTLILTSILFCVISFVYLQPVSAFCGKYACDKTEDCPGRCGCAVGGTCSWTEECEKCDESCGDINECGSCGSVAPCGGCFLSNTKIATPGGEKNINQIKEGDTVQSYNPDTGQLTDNTVSKTYSLNQDHYYEIKTESGQIIKVTNQHPIYTGAQALSSDNLALILFNSYTKLKLYFKDGVHVITSLITTQ